MSWSLPREDVTFCRQPLSVLLLHNTFLSIKQRRRVKGSALTSFNRFAICSSAPACLFFGSNFRTCSKSNTTKVKESRELGFVITSIAQKQHFQLGNNYKDASL